MTSDKKSRKSISGWYEDRYLMAIVQRNFLLIFTAISSIGILICLILIKNFYEGKTVEPYLIEVDKRTGIASVVDAQTKVQYTSNEIVRESYIMKYIYAREQFSADKNDEYQDIIRVLSSPSTYGIYLKQQSNIPPNEKLSSNDRIEVGVKSIIHFSNKLVEIKFTKENMNKIGTRKHYLLKIGFDFLDIEMSLRDRYINPFGFQVNRYDLMEEKILYQQDKNDVQQ